MSDIYFIGGRQSDALTPTLVGNKAANLARLDGLGLRVPPAVALGTPIARRFLATGRLPQEFSGRLRGSIRQVEQATGLTFGGRDPLLVSVRSSPPRSMPGMLDSVLDVGLSEDAVHGLIRRTGNPWLAWDAYRRAVRSFGEVVRGVPPALFEAAEQRHVVAASATGLHELDPLALRDLARDLADLLRAHGGHPADPMEQLTAAIEAVFRSWASPRAEAYRRMNGIGDGTGTGVVVQAMVFGNAGPRSGSGVGFTRNPATGMDQLYVDFVFNGQGEDVVAGRSPVTDNLLLPIVLPHVATELEAAKRVLEAEFRDMQDFEFTVEEGQLFFLQTRDAKRTSWAALQAAVDMVQGGILTSTEALERLAGLNLGAIARVVVRSADPAACLATGTGASPGVATGGVVVSASRAEHLGRERRVMLVRPEVATNDVAGLALAAGMLTATGGRTSHAAVVARQLNTPCVVGCGALTVDEAGRACTIGDRTFREGDVITIDGDTGQVFAGAVDTVAERPVDLLRVVEGWRAAELAGAIPTRVPRVRHHAPARAAGPA